MSTADWHDAYWRDQKYPQPLDGHSYIRGSRSMSSNASQARRHLAKLKHPQDKRVIVTVLRLHAIRA